MEPRSPKRSPLTTVAVIDDLLRWLSNQIKAGHQVNLTPAMVNPRLLMPRTPYDRGGRRHDGHASLANVHILLVVSRVFHSHGVADLMIFIA